MRSLAESAFAVALLVPLLTAVGLTEQASTAEPDEIGAAEGSQTPSQPVSTDTPYVVHRGLGRGTMGWAHVRVGTDDRASAQKLCADLLGAGVTYCEVQRTRSAIP